MSSQSPGCRRDPREPGGGCSAGWVLCLALSPLPSQVRLRAGVCKCIYFWTQTLCLLYSMLRFTSHIPVSRRPEKASARAAGAHPSWPGEGKAQISQSAKTEPSRSTRPPAPGHAAPRSAWSPWVLSPPDQVPCARMEGPNPSPPRGTAAVGESARERISWS